MGDYYNFLRDKANQLMSGARLTAGQAVDRVKALPQTTTTISDNLRSIPGMSDIRPPSGWDIEASMRAAKDRLLGIYRGYVAPALR